MAPMTERSEAQQRALRVGRSAAGRRVWSLTHWLVRNVMYRFFRARLRGTAALATPGPLIIAPVHRSNLDSLLIGAACPRRFWALSKESLFTNSVFAWLISALGAFPIRRGAADRDALSSARDLLEQGEAVLVFPEGTRQAGPVVAEVFDGVAFLAARTGAQVVPIAVAGTEAALPPGRRWPRRTQVVLTAGDPIPAPAGSSGRVTIGIRRAFSADLRVELQRLLDEAVADAALPL